MKPRPRTVALLLALLLVLLGSPAAAQDTEALYRTACDGGDLVACDVLGLMYLAGDGVFQDLERAIALFGRACDGGEPAGCNHLGLMYHTGAGVAADMAAAINLYRRACELGEPTACTNLQALGLTSPDTLVTGEFVRSGRVLDAEGGAPLEGAIVSVPELEIRLTTGASGRVELGRMPEGRYEITAERLGYEPLEGEIEVPWDGEFLLLMTPIQIDDLDAPGRVIGQVTDEEGGEGLSDVAITVSGTRRIGTLSDARGRFQLTVNPGLVQLEFTHLGFAPRSTSLIVQPGRTVEVDATMSTEAIELEPIEVTVRSGYLERNGFYRRARGVRGRQFTRDELDELDPTYVSDLFWRIPGATVRYGADGARVINRRGASFTRGPCEMTVFMDGMPMGGWDLDQIPPDWLEAVEVYSGANTPIRYSSGFNPCGVVLLWTRRGR